MIWVKADGKYIEVSFDANIISDVATCNVDAIYLTYLEFDFVPEGTASTVVRSIESISEITQSKILLTMPDMKRFESAYGDITVIYDCTMGNLLGDVGLVNSFAVTFTPSGLAPKPDQNDAEHISVSVDVVSSLIPIITSSAKAKDEHISIVSVVVTTDLIHIDDV